MLGHFSAPLSPAGGPVPVCRRCGLCVRTQGPCRGCADGRLPEPLAAEPAPMLWAALRSVARCRACFFPTALHGVALQPSVRCEQCGLEQPLLVQQWPERLRFTHRVADLGFPWPGGRFEQAPHHRGEADDLVRDLGYRGLLETDLELGPGACIQVEAGPAAPSCRSCGEGLLRCEPVAADPSAASSFHARCSHCGASRRYPVVQIPGFGALWLVAEGLELDLPQARLSPASAGSTHTLHCPRCGAPLRFDGLHARVQCTHCGCDSLVPPDARHALLRALGAQGRSNQAPLCYVGFFGPSDARRSAVRSSPPPPSAPSTALAMAPAASPNGAAGATKRSRSARPIGLRKRLRQAALLLGVLVLLASQWSRLARLGAGLREQFTPQTSSPRTPAAPPG